RRLQAIQIMRGIVKDDPGYLWGWRNLAQWYDAEGRTTECLEATENMVRLSPTDALSYGYRGEARRATGDHAGARADFARAYELDSSFDAAGLHLVAELLRADQLSEAESILAKVAAQSQTPLVLVRGVQVACRRGDRILAEDRFLALLTHRLSTRGSVAEAIQAMDDAGNSTAVDDLIADQLDADEIRPLVATLWVERAVHRDRAWDVAERFPKLVERSPEAGTEAILTYAELMALADRPEATAATIHRYGDLLRSTTGNWSRTAQALHRAKLHAVTAAWMSDWPEREDLDAATLEPLVTALHALDRDAEAAALCQHAIDLGGPREILAEFRGWLAIESAMLGNYGLAAEHLQAIDLMGLPDGARLVIAVAEALVMVAKAGPEGKKSAFQEAQEHLKVAAGACSPSEVPRGLARRYKPAVHRLASEAGLITARLWAAWQQVRPLIREA
ncbi:MAG: tetratricopeptide repeat protein, partial [Gemmataceae bacterium]